MVQKCPSKACVCASITVWVIISILVLTTTIVIYLRPFLQTLRYSKTGCTVQNTFYVMQYICSCGEGCQSSYPCFMVQVILNNTNKHETVIPLYIDDIQQRFVLENSGMEQEKCSLRVCHSDHVQNRADIRAFKQQMEHIPSHHICYYDPWVKSRGAVLRLHLPSVNVFYAILFPSVSVFLGFIACIVFCRWCRAKEHLNCSNKDSETKSIRLSLIEKQDSGDSLPLNNCKIKEPPNLKLINQT